VVVTRGDVMLDRWGVPAHLRVGCAASARVWPAAFTWEWVVGMHEVAVAGRRGQSGRCTVRYLNRV